MGSDRHYPEEAPAHQVTVDGFWMDRYPVTNAVPPLRRGDRHVTLAERPPNRRLPGREARMLVAVFGGLPQDRGPGRPRESLQLVDVRAGRRLAASAGPDSSIEGPEAHPVVHVAYEDVEPTRTGPARSCRPRPSGSSPRAAGSTARSTPGATSSRRAASRWPTPGRASSRGRTCSRTATRDRAGRVVPAERLRPLRHDRQRLGVDDGLVRRSTARSSRPAAPDNPAAAAARAELRPVPARDQHPAQGDEGRLVPVRAELLPPRRPIMNLVIYSYVNN